MAKITVFNFSVKIETLDIKLLASNLSEKLKAGYLSKFYVINIKRILSLRNAEYFEVLCINLPIYY